MASSSDDRITTWAVAAGGGDRDAMVEFITATQRHVHRFLIHLGGAASAEDLVQETYLRAFTALPRFAAEASALTWLLSIARRVAADEVRRARRRPRIDWVGDWEQAGAAAAPVQRPPDGEVVLRGLIAALEPARREAFVLTQALGLSYAEAAEVCGCPIGTIRSRVARAREDLAAAFAERVQYREA